jgi:hypothetical protein
MHSVGEDSKFLAAAKKRVCQILSFMSMFLKHIFVKAREIRKSTYVSDWAEVSTG